ncbi:MAG: hypothetical protein A3J46_01110 [Candidatus Yanofskybacteria bacterium RIFCSPHIGHO2_02_FULL_41_11]|uniref:Uncharacterized protein n=1 Tax=Candidatus Yanofskybacteria bacterium RIFCSPHIGHO2_02_FULL_41_11 TaxID=1802675 RepID=A0A1F8F504_9BACT|nr:MAG: hypothetical protein A3J46_01110 [Candidatus Yanofskybacteria bacterium RIFCSPHIGHO2_02_FULL_41_11]
MRQCLLWTTLGGVVVREPLLRLPLRPAGAPRPRDVSRGDAVLATPLLLPEDDAPRVAERERQPLDPVVFHEPGQSDFHVVLLPAPHDDVIVALADGVHGWKLLVSLAVGVVLAVALVETEGDVAERNLRPVHHALLVRPDPEEIEENRFPPPQLGELLRGETADLNVVRHDTQYTRDELTHGEPPSEVLRNTTLPDHPAGELRRRCISVATSEKLRNNFPVVAAEAKNQCT